MTIGSSDIAVLLGGRWTPPYTDASPWGVLRRCQGRPLPQRDTHAQRLGRTVEVGLLMELGARVGMLPTPGPGLDQAPFPIEDFAHARPDGILRGGGELVPAELKMVQRFGHEWGPAGGDGVAPYYLPQCWWHMAAMKSPRCYLGAMSRATGEFRVYRIERDLEVEQLALSFARGWYQRHVIEGLPLAFDGSLHARRSLDERYPPPATGGRPDRYVEAHTSALYQLYSRLSERKREVDAALEQVNDAIRAAVGPAGRIRNSAGKVLVTYGDSKPREHVDLEALRLEAPELVAKHTTTREPKTPRTIRVYPGKEAQ